MPLLGRRNKRGCFGLFTALLGLILAAGPVCSAAATPEQTGSGPENRGMRLFTDDLKRTRKIPEQIKRLVVLSGPAVEVTWAMGKGDLIVARSEWATWPPQMKKLPSLGSIIRPNQELIWELKPDVIVADMHFRKSAPFMERMGVPVVFLSAVHVEDIGVLVERMGRLLNKPKRAQELRAFVQKYMNAVKKPLQGLKPQEMPRVFHGSGRQLYFTSSSKYGRRVIDEAGAINIADSLPFYWQQVSPEWLVCEDPDYMVLSPNLAKYSYEVPERKAMSSLWEHAANRPGIRSMRLTRDNHLYLLNARLGYGLRSFIGAIYMAKIFHPDLFPDLDPKQIHARFLEKFYGLKLEGSYLYP